MKFEALTGQLCDVSFKVLTDSEVSEEVVAEGAQVVGDVDTDVLSLVVFEGSLACLGPPRQGLSREGVVEEEVVEHEVELFLEVVRAVSGSVGRREDAEALSGKDGNLRIKTRQPPSMARQSHV